MAPLIKVGCCGFCTSRKKYFSLFSVVEVQKTFYTIPKKDLMKKWRKEAPPDFEFTVKAWMGFTHDPRSSFWKKKGLPDDERMGFLRPSDKNLDLWEEFLSAISPLEPSVIIFQTPSSFKATESNIKNLVEFFESIKRGNFVLGLEVRDPSWFSHGELGRILSSVGVIHVTDPLFDRVFSVQDILYFRLHGTRKGGRIVYKHRYSDEELLQVAKLSGEAEVAYVMFNNVYMKDDALRFMELIRDTTNPP